MADHLAWILRTLLPISPFSFLPTRRVDGDYQNYPIVIIGSDTGMANALCHRLVNDLKMKRIYAGCFTEAGEKSLQLICFKTFRIDVRDLHSVEAAAKFIAEYEPEGVFAVANVAGAMFGGPIEWTSIDVFRTEMDLNFFGLLNVAKTFLQLLKKWKKGRSRFIAVTSTIAVMPSFPGLAGYASSKSAADTLINTLRVEVKPFGIDVLTICPGITKTPFLAQAKNQMLRAWNSAPNNVKEEYGDVYANWLADRIQLGIDRLARDQSDAVNCLLDATTAAWPKTRYFCGIDARLFARPAVHVPDFIWDTGLDVLSAIAGRPQVKSKL